MAIEIYKTTIAYVDHTGGALRPFHSAIMDAIREGGDLPGELADMVTMTKPPGVNADGSARWVINWA